MEEELCGRMLRAPREGADVVLDAAPLRRPDDGFALAWMLLRKDRIRLEGICAAPYRNETIPGTAVGRKDNQEQLEQLLALAGAEGIPVLEGAPWYLLDEENPAASEGARFLVERAMAHTPERPLYVVCTATATDVASAWLLEKQIAERMVVIWLGGAALHCMEREDPNLTEDVSAARVLFDSGIPLVHVPYWGVAEHCAISMAELSLLREGGPLCRCLLDQMAGSGEENPFRSRNLGSAAAVAWLLNGEDRYLESRRIRTPVPLRQGYRLPEGRPPMEYVHRIRRDALVSDLMTALLESGL